MTVLVTLLTGSAAKAGVFTPIVPGKDEELPHALLQYELNKEKIEIEEPTVFEKAPSDEAAARLEPLDKRREERERYQLETQVEALQYQKENRDIALWYVRALARAHFRQLVEDSRESLRKEREREALREEALTEQERAQNGRDGEVVSDGEFASTQGQDGFDEVLKTVVTFLSRLTDEGVSVAAPDLVANFHLDTSSMLFEVRLRSTLFDISLDYRINNSQHPLPFSEVIPGMAPEVGAERMFVSGSRTFEELGLSGTVSYELESRNVHCSLHKTIAGPLTAAVDKSWRFASGEVDAANARLMVSTNF